MVKLSCVEPVAVCNDTVDLTGFFWLAVAVIVVLGIAALVWLIARRTRR
jgi:hypothetical protein